MTDPRTGCPERALDPPEYEALPACCACGEIDGLIEVDGKRYCEEHFKAAFCKGAPDTVRRAFIRAHVDDWCDFFVESVENEHFSDVPPAFLDALRKLIGNDYFEREFCETWAEDEFFEFMKGELECR